MLSSTRETFGLAKQMNFHPRNRKAAYTPPAPAAIKMIPLAATLDTIGRSNLAEKQLDFLRSGSSRDEVFIHVAGDLTALDHPCVSIVGTRDVSSEGKARAARLARELVAEGVTIVSGLAKGVDTAAHSAAIENGGRTIAVIGTPLDKAYPAENAALQESIYKEHLLISPFRIGETVFKGNFPKRNRVMAAISDATVIIEASDTSGTLHQAAECQRLGRWLFIAKSVAEDPSLTWPARFVGKPNVGILKSVADILQIVRR
jgi:DNA processing protein